MKKKSIIILALMVVISILLNYVAFMGIEIAGFKYDSLFGDDLFSQAEVVETPVENETDAEETPADENAEEDDEVTYVGVDDDEVLQAVFDLFKEQAGDEFDFEE